MVLSKVSETLIFVLDNSGVGIGSTLYKLYSQMVGIPIPIAEFVFESDIE